MILPAVFNLISYYLLTQKIFPISVCFLDRRTDDFRRYLKMYQNTAWQAPLPRTSRMYAGLFRLTQPQRFTSPILSPLNSKQEKPSLPEKFFFTIFILPERNSASNSEKLRFFTWEKSRRVSILSSVSRRASGAACPTASIAGLRPHKSPDGDGEQSPVRTHRCRKPLQEPDPSPITR